MTKRDLVLGGVLAVACVMMWFGYERTSKWSGTRTWDLGLLHYTVNSHVNGVERSLWTANNSYRWDRSKDWQLKRGRYERFYSNHFAHVNHKQKGRQRVA